MTDTIFRGTAPGRLDMLGGVADYSGALVLELPLQATTTVELHPRHDPRMSFESEQAPASFELSLHTVNLCCRLPLPQLVNTLDELAVPGFVRYLLGCYLLLVRENLIPPSPKGLRFKVSSEVPLSMGVSSSAALEVATMKALAACFALTFQGTELARLAQRVENDIVGAPCGLMDQLASAYGVSGSLTPILCRPDQVYPSIPLPTGLCLVGWASGVEHDVSGSPYATTRCATFMGFEMFKRHTGQNWSFPAEIPSGLFEEEAHAIPETLTGRQFLEEVGSIRDPLSVIDPDVTYRLRAGLSFPIAEHQRATRVVHELRSPHPVSEILPHIGEAMRASHEGYSAIGLGHPATDAMVSAIRQCGPEQGFFGARVSGGGCGGTVVVLLHSTALLHLEELCRQQTPKGQLIL